MNIAILSMQEVKNYGSFLQAYSLKTNIEALGHQCEFINIQPGEQLGVYKQSKYRKIFLFFQRIWGIDFFKRFYSIYRFQSRFSKEFLPYLGVYSPTANQSDRHYDVVVIGSDEVFNCAQKTWFGYSKQLFGFGLNTDKVISYAASFGATDISKLSLIGKKEEVSKMLKKFCKISVRDNNSFMIVEGLTGIKPEINVDPVFLLDYERLMPLSVPMERYIIIYTYPGRITDKKEIAAIKNIAATKSLKLISIGHYFSWCDKVVIPSPFEVLTYFKNASYIITDTFHGSVFSIKYEKQFCTIVRDMNANKLTSLLGQFGLSSRQIKDLNQLESLLDTAIDYIPVRNIISTEREKSISYLKENI